MCNQKASEPLSDMELRMSLNVLDSNYYSTICCQGVNINVNENLKAVRMGISFFSVTHFVTFNVCVYICTLL